MSEEGSGASIHMGQGGHVPPIFGLGGHYHECPLNISRVISATFYPCNIFLKLKEFLVFLVFSRLVQGVVGTL